jgi:hypothetical protein
MELSTNPEEVDKYLQNYLQNFLHGQVEEKYLKEFSKSLFPCSN